MKEETREHHIIVKVPKDIPSEFVHKIYENVIEEAVQVFYKKNHDYNSSWRLESVDSVTREILTRCYRTLKLLELESKGQEGKVAEGIESELKDVINWAIFGVLLRRGYGLSIDEGLADPVGIDLNSFESKPVEEAPKKQDKFSKKAPQQDPEVIQSEIRNEFQDVLSPELENATKVILGDPKAGVTPQVTRELNCLYQSLMQRSNPYPAVIFLEDNNPINNIGRFAIGPFVYTTSRSLWPDHPQLFVDSIPVDKIVYIRVTEKGAFDGKYETDTEAQILSQLFFMPQHKPSGEVDLHSQNIAANLFIGSKR